MKKVFAILKYLREYKKQAFTCVAFNVVSAIFGSVSVIMIIPFLSIIFGKELVETKPEFSMTVDYFIDSLKFFLSGVMERSDRGPVIAISILSGFILITTFIKTGSRYLTLFFLAPIKGGIIEKMRNRIFGKVVRLPLSFYNEERKGDIISRISQDVQEIQNSVVSSIEAFVNNPFIILFNLIILIALSPMLTLFVLILLPLSGYLIGRIAKTLKNPSYKGQIKLGEILSIIEETITGLRIVKAFNGERKMEGKFEEANGIFTKLIVKINRRKGLSSPLSEFLGTVVIIMIFVFGSALIFYSDGTQLDAEKMIGYIGAFYLIINPAKAFSNAYYNVQKGLAAIDRVNEVLDADDKIVDAPDAVSKTDFNHSIEYRNVNFKYVDDLVLKNVNLKIEKGKTIALVGASGSGKSTMADMLPRLIEIEDGALLIDDVNVKKMYLKDLRNLLGFVTQQSILFNDSVFNNIAFNNEKATMEDVIEAAKVANAHEFIEHMPDGYQTNIGDMGGKLSGGQRQRLTIARAVLKNPPILILDEATSALDTESERLVQEALTNLMKNRTSIVIAHRLSTIKHADEIVVLHEGEIVEKGKHDELISKEGAYKKLHDLQMFS